MQLTYTCDSMRI